MMVTAKFKKDLNCRERDQETKIIVTFRCT